MRHVKGATQLLLQKSDSLHAPLSHPGYVTGIFLLSLSEMNSSQVNIVVINNEICNS